MPKKPNNRAAAPGGRRRGAKDRLATVRAGFGLCANIFAAVLDIDGRPVGIGQKELARNPVPALDFQISLVRRDAEAGADHDVQSRVEPGLPRFLNDAGKAQHGPGDVLVVVSFHVLNIHAGRRGVAKRHAGDRAGFPALVLKLMEEGWHQAAVVRDVEPAVVRLHSADELRGALRRIGISMEHPAGRPNSPPGRPRRPTAP